MEDFFTLLPPRKEDILFRYAGEEIHTNACLNYAINSGDAYTEGYRLYTAIIWNSRSRG